MATEAFDRSVPVAAAQTAVRRRGWWRRNQRRLAPWLFLAPGAAMFLVYVVLPIFESIGISLYEWDGIGEKNFVGFANYQELWTDDAF